MKNLSLHTMNNSHLHPCFMSISTNTSKTQNNSQLLKSLSTSCMKTLETMRPLFSQIAIKISVNIPQTLDEKLESCNIMERTKDNRDIVGTFPSADLKTFGNLAIQSPPETRSMRHSSDIYTKEELLKFVDSLLPNFYK